MRKTIGQYVIATCLAFLIIGLVAGVGYMILFQVDLLALIVLGIMVVAGLISWIVAIKEEIYGV